MKSNQPKRRRKELPSALTENDGLISLLGKKFGVMVDPWIESATFQLERPEGVRADDPGRYSSPASIKQAKIVEVYEFVPERLHVAMTSHSHFGTLVRSIFCSFIPIKCDETPTVCFKT